MTARAANAGGAFWAASGSVLALLASSARAIDGAGPVDDIHDIRAAKLILAAWMFWAAIAAVILLAAAGYGLWRWWRGRRKPRVLLPFEVALARLEELRSWLEPERAREFSTTVSDIVRRYIEQRFDIIATHRTTEEFLRDLLSSSQSSLARHRPLLSAFLHQCDLVKFAGMSLTRDNMESLHGSARAFVLETKDPDLKEAHDPLPAT